MSISTAGSTTDIGRGDPFTLLICSEISFYRDAGQVMRAMLPRAKRAKKIFEATGNGTSGWFYKQCKKAWGGEGIYDFTFIPPFRHHEYTKGDNIKLYDKSEYELSIQEDYNLTDGQLAWRRDTINELDDDEEMGMSGEDSFKQEYPLTSEEGFLKSGSAVFGSKVYQRVEQTICEPVFVGDIAA